MWLWFSRFGCLGRFWLDRFLMKIEIGSWEEEEECWRVTRSDSCAR